MIEESANSGLRLAFEHHLAETQNHVSRVEQVFSTCVTSNSTSAAQLPTELVPLEPEQEQGRQQKTKAEVDKSNLFNVKSPCPLSLTTARNRHAHTLVPCWGQYFSGRS
jgi:hypothetical protein